MNKVFENQTKKRDDVASTTANIHGVTPAYVRMVVNGKRINEEILATYSRIKQAKEDIVNTINQVS